MKNDTAMIAAMSSPFAWIGKQALAALLGYSSPETQGFRTAIALPGFPAPVYLGDRSPRWNVQQVSDFMRTMQAHSSSCSASEERKRFCRNFAK